MLHLSRIASKSTCIQRGKENNYDNLGGCQKPKMGASIKGHVIAAQEMAE